MLLSKRANSSLQVSTDAHCDIEVTPGAEELDLMFRAKPIGGPLTHTIKGKDDVEHMCRIDSHFSWGKPTDPRPTVLVGRDDMVVVQWSDVPALSNGGACACARARPSAWQQVD